MKLRRLLITLCPIVIAIVGIISISTIFAEATDISSTGWLQVNTDGFGDPHNSSGSPFSFKGDLYASTYNVYSGTDILKYTGVGTWTEVITEGFGNPQNDWIPSFGIFSDTLYASTRNIYTGLEIFTSTDGTTWYPAVSGGFGDPNNMYVYDFIIFQEQFYAATRNNNGGQVWRSANGSDWTQVNTGGFGVESGGVWSLAIFQEHLYAGVGWDDDGGWIWKTSDGINWIPVINDGFGDNNNTILGYDMSVFDNHLYASTYNEVTGGEIWRFDGEGWEQNNMDGFGNSNNTGARSLLAVNGALYAGVRNGVEGASVWVFKESSGWVQDSTYGFDDPGNIAIHAMAVHDDSLFAGTQNDGTGGEVWAKSLPPLLIGFIPDENGINDESGFNTLAYSGVLRTESELGVMSTVYTPSSDLEYELKLQECAEDNNDLCISVGFSMAHTTTIVANEITGTRFAIVDGHTEFTPENLRNMLFNEKESGYMAGALGGLMTESDILGGVGGPNYVKPVVDFIEGYRNGAQCVNEDAIVLYEYAHTFTEPDLGAAMAQDMMAQGADTIFGAAGLTGEGAVVTATQSGAWGIGVDTDWYINVFDNGGVEGADKLLSSAMKKLDNAVFATILDVISGAFTSGTIVYDLAMDGVGLAPYHETDPYVTPPIESQIEDIRVGIINGTIDIHDPCRETIYLPIILK